MPFEIQAGVFAFFWAWGVSGNAWRSTHGWGVIVRHTLLLFATWAVLVLSVLRPGKLGELL